MGKIIKRGVPETEKFENKCCCPEASMSQALLGRASGKRRQGTGSHTCAGSRAVLGHHTCFLHLHTALGSHGTMPTLQVTNLRLREDKLLALDICRISKRSEPWSTSLKKEIKIQYKKGGGGERVQNHDASKVTLV